MNTRAESIVHSDKGIVSGTPVFKGTRVPVQNMFDYLAYGEDLKDFHFGFPSVHPDQAISALEVALDIMLEQVKARQGDLYHSDPRIMGGTYIFVGTQEEINSLFRYLMEGRSVKDFLYDFPSIEPCQTEAALRFAQQLLEREAYEAAS